VPQGVVIGVDEETEQRGGERRLLVRYHDPSHVASILDTTSHRPDPKRPKRSLDMDMGGAAEPVQAGQSGRFLLQLA